MGDRVIRLIVLVGCLAILFAAPSGATVQAGHGARATVASRRELGESVLYTHGFGISSAMVCRTRGWKYCGTRVYSSHTGGKWWRDITPRRLRGADTSVHDFTWLSSKVGWVAVDDCAAAESYVYRTTDGGAHWRRSPVPGVSCNAGSVLNLDFVDPFHGYLTGTDLVGVSIWFSATSDGGKTWSDVSEFGEPGVVSFSDSAHGYLASHYRHLFATSDDAQHWERVRLGKPSRYRDAYAAFDAPTFFRDGYGVLPVTWVKRERGNLAFFVTEDAGASWHLASVLKTRVRYHRAIHAYPVQSSIPGRKVWWVSGHQRPIVWVTKDGGRSWSRHQTNFTDQAEVKAAGPHSAFMNVWGDEQVKLYRTRDGGRHWRRLSPI